MLDNELRSRVDWTPVPGKPDWVYGASATRTERFLARFTGAIGAVLLLAIVAYSAPGAWQPWQFVVAALLAYDLLGGVVANGLNSAKRDHFGPRPEPTQVLGKLVRRPVLFTSLHVHPIVVGLLFAGADWWWGLAWYGLTLGSVIVVRRSRLYVQRPAAFAYAALAAVAATVFPAPVGFAWLPVVLALKLTVAHAVQEEPYRPVGD